MELSLVSIVVIVLVVWYFGSTLNKLVTKADHIIDNSSEMMTDEFNLLRKEQQVRIIRATNEIGKTIQNTEVEFTEADVLDMLKDLKTGTRSK